MSVVFDALREEMLQSPVFSGIDIEPYVARIEDGMQQSRGVGISVADESPFGERRLRGRRSSLRSVRANVAVMTKDYAATESMVKWFTDLDAEWGRPRLWSVNRESRENRVDISVLAFTVTGVGREETAERYFRATIGLELTYRPPPPPAPVRDEQEDLR